MMVRRLAVILLRLLSSPIWVLGPLGITSELLLSSRGSGSPVRFVSFRSLAGLGSTWTPKVCKIMTFMAVIMGLGLLFYILLGFR